MTLFNLPTTGPGVLLVHAGDDPGIIVNRDLVNPVLLANNSASPGFLASILDPLTFVQFSGEVEVYGLAVNAFVTVDVMPQMQNWSPSPAQSAASIAASGIATAALQNTQLTAINNPGYGPATGANQVTQLSAINNPAYGPATAAAQATQLSAINAPSYGPATLTAQNAQTAAINNPSYGPSTLAAQNNQNTAIPNNIAATGVPALNLKSTNTVASVATITAGATQALSAVTGINQPAYNLHLTATSGASSTKPWYTVTVSWVDTASGLVVQKDAYTAFMSSVSNTLSTVIAGPTDADQCQISVTNNDSVTMTLNVAFFVLSSRTNYTTDAVYQFWTSATMPSIPTFQIGASLQVPTSRVLFSINRSVGVSTTTTPDYAMPVYSGPVTIHFDGSGSNNWDIVFTDQYTGATMHRQTYTGAPALGNVQVILPRTPITLHLTNNGSVSGTANLEVAAA